MKFVIAFLIGVISTLVFSQEPLVIAINKNQGLSSNTVYNILQDKQGFIWLTSNDGLFKYDGASFKNYVAENQSSLAGSALQEDIYGRIWYQNFDGFLFYLHNGKLKQLANQSPVDYISQGITKKYVFAATENGISVYDLKNLKHKKTISIGDEFLINTFVSENDFYFISKSSIYKIDENLNKKFITNLPTGKTFWYITKFKKEILFVSRNNSSKQLFCLKNNKIVHFADFNFEQEILDFKSFGNNIWIFSADGVYIYEINKNKLIQKHHILKGKKITNGLIDNTGNYWFSSLLEGVFLIPDLKRQLIQTPTYKPLKIIKSGENFILGTKNHQLLETNCDFTKIKEINKGKTNSDVYYLFRDESNGNIFYSSNGSNLLVSGKNNQNISISFAVKEVEKIDEKFYIIAASGLVALYENPIKKTKFNSIWDELFLKNKDTLQSKFAPIITGLRSKSVVYDKINKKIYVATNKGLFVINSSFEKNEIRLNGNTLYCQKVVLIDNKLFALSSIGDLYEILGENKIKSLNRIFSFDSKSIRQLICSDSYLILRSNTKLKIFNKSTFKLINELNVSNFDIYDVYFDKNNFIVLTDKGILSLPNTHQTDKKNIIPKLIFNSIIADSKVYENYQNLSLSSFQDNVEIHFSLLNYGNRNESNLFYKINNKKWTSIENKNRILKFASLAPGNYSIKFKWFDKKNHIYKEQINFTIETPFYKEIWFISLCLVFIFALIFSYFRWQVSNLKNKNQLMLEKMTLEKNLSKSMLTSIKSQMNPHFFYNALNTIQSYIFLNDKKNASNFLSKFSNLTRMILEMSDKETITLSEELKALHLYLDLEKMRFDDAFEFDFQLDDKIDCDLCKIPSMLIQPYIENAIKHGLLHKDGNKRLEIKFSLENQILLVEIKDNGVGRKRAEELKKIKAVKYESFSSNANAKRLEILNKGLHFHVGFEIIDLYSNNQAVGTHVKLTIPIQ